MAALVICLSVFVASGPDDTRDAAPVFLARLDATPWPTAWRNPPNRVERDVQGRIVLLRLDGMKLQPGDLQVLRGFVHLQRLSFNSTNLDDSQLKSLRGLPGLVGLSLNRTSITDRGVESLAEFPQLKTLCLGSVKVSRQAVQMLKEKRPKMAIGYSPSAN
jgi:hypothetical protein